MNGIAGRLRKSIDKRGAIGTVGFGMRLAAQLFSGVVFAKYLRRRRTWREDRAFDEVHGIETAGQVNNNLLSTDSRNRIYAVSYEPINAAHFMESIGALQIRHEDFVFVDLGCGKGRAILLAAGYPFRRIVGVEFDAGLVQVARDNIARYPAELIRCNRIEVLCRDATCYDFPEDPLLIYLYNPFEAPVMKQVVESIRASYERNPRKILVAYFTPMHADVWDAQRFLSRVPGDGDPVLYATPDPDGLAAGR